MIATCVQPAMVEVLSKPQIRFAGKAPGEEKAQSRCWRDEPIKETGKDGW
jgi:hypothetical protein